MTGPDAELTDQIVTVTDGRQTVRDERHRLGDYFERLCVLPGANGEQHELRLFFERKPAAGRLWKDVMGMVLKSASHASIKVWIGLDYRVDDERVYAVASQVPRWFAPLGLEAKRFWIDSATFLLKHPWFSFADVEEISGVAVDSLKARYRNSCRAIKKEGSPDPLWQTFDQRLQTNIYRMEPVVRDEILCLGKEISADERQTPSGLGQLSK